MKNAISTYFLVCKNGRDRSNDDVGGARGTICKEIRPRSGFKTGDFVEEKLGRLPKNDSEMKKKHWRYTPVA